jgi:rubrerythrin
MVKAESNKWTVIGIDLASGPDKTVWSCRRCGNAVTKAKPASCAVCDSRATPKDMEDLK